MGEAWAYTYKGLEFLYFICFIFAFFFGVGIFIGVIYGIPFTIGSMLAYLIATLFGINPDSLFLICTALVYIAILLLIFLINCRQKGGWREVFKAMSGED